jgi:site-specific DNA recombinase
LQAALSDAAIRAEAAESLGSLIEKVVLTPDDAALDGLAAELHGDLAMILTLTLVLCRPGKYDPPGPIWFPRVFYRCLRGHDGV